MATKTKKAPISKTKIKNTPVLNAKKKEEKIPFKTLSHAERNEAAFVLHFEDGTTSMMNFACGTETIANLTDVVRKLYRSHYRYENTFE